MNLPQRVDDPSLREHEPLRTCIVMCELSDSRFKSKGVISRFTEKVQQNGQAAAAVKKWAQLLFEDTLSNERSFEVTDGGQELYKAFFEYQIRLAECPDEARKYQAHLFRRGIGAINITDHGLNTPQYTGGRGKQGRGKQGKGSQRCFSSRHKTSSPKNGRRQTETAVKYSDAGVTAIAWNPGCGPYPTKSSSVTQSKSLDAPNTAVAEAAEQSARLASGGEKKRKACSQKPPVITASDASGDDKEPSEIRLLTATNFLPHRSKRVASNPCRRPHNLFGVRNQVDKTSSAEGPQYPVDTGFSKRQSSLIRVGFEDTVSSRSIKGRRGIRFPSLNCKRDREKVSKVVTRLTGASTKPRRPGNRGLVKHLQTRASKRLRRASMSTLDGEPEGTEPTYGPQAPFVQEPTIRGSLFTAPPSIRKNTCMTPRARTKRTRNEFETGYVAPDESMSADSHEPLGPDYRALRPLPKRVRGGRSAPVVSKDSSFSGVPCGASLEYTDQLLRDAASNALLALREEARPDAPDWTEDGDHDVECDDFEGDDYCEAKDDQVATVAFGPSVVVPKPPLSAPPPIWARTRQEVCETFEYFRSFHSGVYARDDIVKGYLLGAYAASRDIFHHGGKLIISHGGGKSGSIIDVRGGPRRYQKDQDQQASDKSVRALLKARKNKSPIALLADDRYVLFPYDLASGNYTYVVLGLYWVSHAWAECQPARDGPGRIVRWKFAFQWCEGQGDPWWLPKAETTVSTSQAFSTAKERSSSPSRFANTGGGVQCGNCREQSPPVYEQGWMCLNPRCCVFWSIDGEEPKLLDYREEFLKLLPLTFEKLPKITPARVPETPTGITTTYAFSKGLHCTQCGRLSCRFKWEHWECSNCQFKHVVTGKLRTPKDFWGQRPARGFLHSHLGKDSGIIACQPELISLGTHKASITHLTFILPYCRGKIHLILGTPLLNADADSIFELYQRQASTGELRLRRYPLRTHRARGSLLTNYFSQNSGEPYQYVGGTGNTIPFHEAPECVQRALALIRERSSLALRTDIPFNEILSAAYMERQKMAFHSDSEKGLGPTVASLSLGSTALMHFRLHMSAETPRNKNTYALTLVLRHGDVLIMEGEGVQKYYEHTVVPMNFRVAATARCIGSTG